MCLRVDRLSQNDRYLLFTIGNFTIERMNRLPQISEIIILLLVGITAVLWFYMESKIGNYCFLILLIYMFFRFYKNDNGNGGVQ